MSTNSLTMAQREAMFHIYQQSGSVGRVARKCSVHKKTVKRYKELDNWDERRGEIERAVQSKSDEKSIGRRLRNVLTLDKAIEAIADSLQNGGEIENKMLPKLIATQEVLLGRGAADDETPDMTVEELAALELLKALPPGGLEALANIIVNQAQVAAEQPLLGAPIETEVEVVETRPNTRKRKPKSGKGKGRPKDPMHLSAS